MSFKLIKVAKYFKYKYGNELLDSENSDIPEDDDFKNSTWFFPSSEVLEKLNPKAKEILESLKKREVGRAFSPFNAGKWIVSICPNTDLDYSGRTPDSLLDYKSFNVAIKGNDPNDKDTYGEIVDPLIYFEDMPGAEKYFLWRESPAADSVPLDALGDIIMYFDNMKNESLSRDKNEKAKEKLKAMGLPLEISGDDLMAKNFTFSVKRTSGEWDPGWTIDFISGGGFATIWDGCIRVYKSKYYPRSGPPYHVKDVSPEEIKNIIKL